MSKRAKSVAWVVFVGRLIGIHESWQACEESVKGYPRSAYKAYKVYEDAIAAWDKFEQEGVMDVKPSHVSIPDHDGPSMFDAGDDREDIPSQSELQELVLSGKRCGYCSAPTILVDSAEVYHGRSFGPIWRCRSCNAHVGVHKGTHNALGRVAKADLRKAKMAFHDAFDPLWRSGKWNRNALYAELAKRMDIDGKFCHGGMFDVRQCQQAIAILKGMNKVKTERVVKKKEEITYASRAQAIVDTFSVNGAGSVLTNCSCWPNCYHATTNA